MVISTTAKRALLGRSSNDGLLGFVTLEVDSGTLRFVNNPVDMVSGGQTFTAYPFEIGMATDTDESPSIECRIGNVDRQIMLAIEEQTGPPEMTLQMALISTPSTIERTYTQFKLREVTADVGWITGRLGQDRISTEPFPQQRATKTRCPSLFRRA